MENAAQKVRSPIFFNLLVSSKYAIKSKQSRPGTRVGCPRGEGTLCIKADKVDQAPEKGMSDTIQRAEAEEMGEDRRGEGG